MDQEDISEEATTRQILAKDFMSRRIRYVKLHEFGRDHWSTFAYIETLCVDNGGLPQIQRMRCNPKYHPGQAHHGGWNNSYSTRLKGHTDHTPVQLVGHDDWHCVEDLERNNLIKVHGTGLNPVFEVTPLGMVMAGSLRTFKAQGGTYATFDPLTTRPTVHQFHSAVQKAQIIEHKAKKWWSFLVDRWTFT